MPTPRLTFSPPAIPASAACFQNAVRQTDIADGWPRRERLRAQCVGYSLGVALTERSAIDRAGYGCCQRCPPVAKMTSPVIQRAASDARNTATGPMSSGTPTRPRGICATIPD
jgi:hypothetical protein